MIRPREGQVLVRVLPKETKSEGGIDYAFHRVTPEEQQEANHAPKPPPPIRGKVLAIGAWKRLPNGMAVPPPFPPESVVLMREGSGTQLSYGVEDKLRLVKIDDLLAVVIEVES